MKDDKELNHTNLETDQEGFKMSDNSKLENGVKEAVSWEDIELTAKTSPTLVKLARELIKIRLGYLPHYAITLPYEANLRSLIDDYITRKINGDEFYNEADRLIKLIRNDDVKPNDHLVFDSNLYVRYENEHLHFREIAKKRITGFLGYVPSTEHSLFAEIWLRSIMAEDNFQLPTFMTVIDFKVLTTIKYRQVLISQSKESADNSPLLCCGLFD